jgi:hypothetical protein
MTKNSIVEKSKTVWIGDASWIHDPDGVIFMTKKEAKERGWKNPARAKITLERKK